MSTCSPERNLPETSPALVHEEENEHYFCVWCEYTVNKMIYRCKQLCSFPVSRVLLGSSPVTAGHRQVN